MFSSSVRLYGAPFYCGLSRFRLAPEIYGESYLAFCLEVVNFLIFRLPQFFCELGPVLVVLIKLVPLVFISCWAYLLLLLIEAVASQIFFTKDEN